uniref:Pentatricopeptide repeat-containing protein n=1 Tax=Kalanchoe fedtschenkoi TaxID=63787 RepID=A0A7N0V2E0_KALFE
MAQLMAAPALTFQLSFSGQKECNKVIRKQAADGSLEQALLTYIDMQEIGFFADNYTFPVLLKAAAKLRDCGLGYALHCQTVKTGFSSHAFVQTALVNLYGSYGELDNACRVFDSIALKDEIAWNSMLDTYASSGEVPMAAEFFNSMEIKDVASLNIMISGYGSIGHVASARALFDKAPVRDLTSWNSMIFAYTKINDMVEARKLFDSMQERNVITWNSVIAGYVSSQLYSEAVSLFFDMRADDIKPDHLTVSGVLSACSHLGALETGMEVHTYVLNRGMSSSFHVTSSLIGMYANCGCIWSALQVFYKSDVKDIYCWSSMISGLGLHGYGHAALELFDQMTEKGSILPDDITFIAVLSACSHSGLVKQGLELFDKMEADFGLTPKSEHYGCMVDLLARAGLLDQALHLLKTMPFEPGETALGALLSACVTHQDLETGNEVLKLMHSTRGEMSDGEFMMLANLYAACGRWDEADRWRSMMNNAGMVKTAGFSVVEVDGKMYKFLAGDREVQSP